MSNNRLAEALDALDAYADHQSWRCEHPPHWYLADPTVVPAGDCPCGLLGVLARLGLELPELPKAQHGQEDNSAEVSSEAI